MSSIVMIDDEPWALKGIRDIINWTQYGFDNINTFDESSSAFDFIVATNPDLVLTDVRMPDMSGLELIEKCKARGVTSVFVVVSAYADFSYAKKAIDAGVDGYMLKPLKKEDIVLFATKMSERFKTNNTNTQRNVSIYSGSTGKVIAYVDAHFMELLSLQTLADKFNISLSHLSRNFKRLSGDSFTDYVAKKRIDYACKLLKNTDMSISQIGQMVGYQDYFHFSKIFRKRTGKSPSEVRKGN